MRQKIGKLIRWFSCLGMTLMNLPDLPASVCLLKRNGKRQLGAVEQIRCTLGVTKSLLIMYVGRVRRRGLLFLPPVKLPASRLTATDSMIWPAMFGSGVVIGMMITTMGVPRLITRRDLIPQKTKFGEGEHGTFGNHFV